jgi:PAS domain S-box-containing protein
VEICLIEDSEDDADYINELLQQMPEQKKKAQLATTLAQASQLLLNNKFDAIILDINLPDSHGIDTLVQVKKLTKRTPIVILTGEEDERLGSEAVGLGAQDYLFKNTINLNVLRRSILYAIERQRGYEAAQQLATIMETGTDAVVARDLDGTILTWNRGAVEIYGFTAEEATGNKAQELLQSKLPLPFDEIVQILLKEDRWQSEFGRTTKDGQEITVSSRWALSRDDAGAPTMILELSHDISEKKKKEEALRYLGSIVEYSEDAIIGQDLAGKITSWNSGAQQLYQYSADEMIGQNITRVLPRIFESARPELLIKLLQAHELDSIETTAQRKDGTVLDVSLSLSQIKDLQGTVVGASSISRDITEGKIAEANLKTANEELEKKVAERTIELLALNQALTEARDLAQKASKLKSVFVANMSHEIRTPLNAVIGMANILQKTNLKEDQRNYAMAIQESGQSLLHIVNDILDFSKIEAGKVNLEHENFDLVQEIESTCSILATQARTKCLSFMCFVDPQLPQIVCGDSVRLRQILTNLLSNAIKFSDSGEVAVRVSKNAINANSVEIYFSVSDSGIGMSVEEQSRVFEAFEQADGSTSRRFGGSGLGLNITKNLVELMQGTIGVVSNSGDGATFWFTIPFEVVSTLPVTSEKPELKDTRILIFDDEPHARDILQRYVAAWGMRCLSLNDISKAIETLQKAVDEGDPFSIAILDATSPQEESFSVAKQIVETNGLNSTQLIMLNSSEVTASAVNATTQSGIRAFINKPVKQAELLQSLMIALQPTNTKTTKKKSVTTPKAEAKKPQRSERILVAEDNALNQRVMSIYLEELGLDCQIVINGKEAIEAIEKQHFDLILMDCQMPEMDGFEASRAIRQKEGTRGKRVPIIATTASAMKGDREDCLSAGMDDYICKPIEQNELVRILQKWLP